MLDVESARSLVFGRKLGLLMKLMKNDASGIGVNVLRSMMDDVESINFA